METKNKISKKLLYLNAVVAGLIVVFSFAIYFRANQSQKRISNENKEQTLHNATFQKLPILAKSVYVYDAGNDKVIFEKNSDTQFPLASLSKLMMALTASDLLPADSKITIRKEFLGEVGDTGLLANETWRLRDLLDFSLVVSSNDGARSVASVIGAINLGTSDFDLGRKEFISLMNKKAIEIGLTQTYYINENGLDIENFSGGYGTAKDVAKLFQYLIKNKPEIVEVTKYKTLTVDSFSKSHTVNNTNKEIEGISGVILEDLRSGE